MNAEFETKKIQIETLGEYLASVREHLQLTREEVANQTEIFEKFLLYIEEGKYHLLPPDVYVIGFLKKLAELYKVSCEDLLAQFKKERGILEHNAREKMVAKKSWKDELKNITITPKLLTIAGGSLFALVSVSYISWQVFLVNRTPSLTIIEPSEELVLSDDSVKVKGKTDPGASVEVNGQNVFVTEQGEFETTLSIAPGQKDIGLTARNKFGKQRYQNVSLRIDDSRVAGAVTEEPAEMVLELEFTRGTKIILIKDNVELPEEEVPAFATKRIPAKESVIVKTNDAGATRARFNGKSLGSLGKNYQEIEVEFNRQAEELLK
ncbi:MAG: helix-turn-helix domain-containing protein [Candidatus Doudnabacteria bacterium]